MIIAQVPRRTDMGHVKAMMEMEEEMRMEAYEEGYAKGFIGNSVPTQVGGIHYQKKQPQPIEVIEAWDLGFHEANVLKYLSRWKDKNGLEDLKKAQWYLTRLIDKMEMYK